MNDENELCKGCLTQNCFIRDKGYHWECPCCNCLIKTTCEVGCKAHYALTNYLEPHVGRII